MDKCLSNPRPVRFNEKKQCWEILVAGKRWRIAEEITCDNCGKPECRLAYRSRASTEYQTKLREAARDRT